MPKQCFLLFSRRNPMFTVLLKVQNRPKKPISVPEYLSIILLEQLLQNPQSHHQKVGCRHKTPVFHNLECKN